MSIKEFSVTNTDNEVVRFSVENVFATEYREICFQALPRYGEGDSVGMTPEMARTVAYGLLDAARFVEFWNTEHVDKSE